MNKYVQMQEQLKDELSLNIHFTETRSFSRLDNSKDTYAETTMPPAWPYVSLQVLKTYIIKTNENLAQKNKNQGSD